MAQEALKDPFYLQIVSALRGRLDPLVFERCMGDLLRSEFPGLVPVPGGSDSGFDGLIPDATDTYPLVCTTGRDVGRNLRESLDAICRREWPVRKVALATSQALTPPRHLALFEKARSQGFQMMQVFGQEALADRLYRNGRWCRELLQLSLRPSPLGVVPPTRRPLINLEPIGREEALAWLRSARQDCLLSGTPGSGKTFLLHYLIRQGWPGLFLSSADFDEERVALAYNEQRPEWIIVDDAHASGHLESLLSLRSQLGADFKIVATTWEGSREVVLQTLGAAESQSLRLELLTRAEIVRLFRGMGVQADDEILRVMVNQAANKPGLAVTLGSLWLRGEWNEVLDGRALSREVLAFFEKNLEKDATAILTAFSLGGDAGMDQERVGDFLRLSRPAVWRILTGLAFGGVLAAALDGTRSVWPRELRLALLRRAFSLESGARSDLLCLLDQAPSRASAVETLVAAEVALPVDVLRSMVRDSGNLVAWELLAQRSEADARWVLANYPGQPLAIARAALFQAPDPAIRLLLDQAVSAPGPAHSQPDHPLRILKDWVGELNNISVKARVCRRRRVARVAASFLASGGDRAVGLHGVLLALAPGLESTSLDPGSGNRFSIFSATVDLEEIAEVRPIWEAHRVAIESLQSSDWPIVSECLWGWAYPEYAARGTHLPKRLARAMRSFAGKLLKDLAPLAASSPGLAAAFLDLADEVGVRLRLRRDPVFELLYPSPDPDGLPSGDTLAGMLKEIAETWTGEGPDWTAERLLLYEGEIRGTGRPCWPRRAPDLVRVMAETVDDPAAWLDTFLRLDLPFELVEPFLERVVSSKDDGEEILGHLLEESRHTAFVASILQRCEVPSAWMDRILEKAAPHLIEDLCQKGRLPLPALRSLLRGTSPERALAAAIGEWIAEPRGEVRPDLSPDWRAAILRTASVAKARPDDDRSAATSYWLEEILRRERDLSVEWIRRYLADASSARSVREGSLLANLLGTLDREQKIVVLDELRRGSTPPGLVGLLVAGDLDLYRKALALANLGTSRLEPLEQLPDGKWAELALAALRAGVKEDEIERASFRAIRSYSGSGLVTYQRWDRAFEMLESDPREEVREIARRGRDRARRLIQRAEEEERRDARREA